MIAIDVSILWLNARVYVRVGKGKLKGMGVVEVIRNILITPLF